MYIGLGFWKISSRKIYAVPESQLKSRKEKHSRLQESRSRQQQCCSDVMLEVKSPLTRTAKLPIGLSILQDLFKLTDRATVDDI